MARGQASSAHLEHSMLLCLAGFHGLAIRAVPLDMVARSVGYTNVASAAFVRAIQALKAQDMIAVASKRVHLTERGIREMSTNIVPPQDNREAMTRIQDTLRLVIGGRGHGPDQIIAFLYSGRAYTRQEVGFASGYMNVASAGLAKTIKALSDLGLVVKVGKKIMLADVAFPSGRP